MRVRTCGACGYPIPTDWGRAFFVRHALGFDGHKHIVRCELCALLREAEVLMKEALGKTARCLEIARERTQDPGWDANGSPVVEYPTKNASKKGAGT